MNWKRNLMFAVGLMVILAGTALAQNDTVKAEVFGGFSYLRTAGSNNTGGWNGQAALYANKWIGGVADIAGHYLSKDSGTGRPAGAIYTILAGPQIVKRAGRLSGFGHFMIGVAHVGQGLPMKGGTTLSGSNNLTILAGGGVDVNVSNKVAVRVIQADWERIRTKDPITFNLEGSNNFRLSMGIVFKVK